MLLLQIGGMHVGYVFIISSVKLTVHCATVDDDLSHSDDMTSFQGVVVDKQAWPYLSKLNSFGWLSVKEREQGGSAQTDFAYYEQCIWGNVKRGSGSACDFKDGSALHAPPSD